LKPQKPIAPLVMILALRALKHRRGVPRLEEQHFVKEVIMDASEIRPIQRLFVHERVASRRPGVPEGSGTHSPVTTSPTNGVPPPVNDVLEVSDAARSEFQAWVARQAGQTATEPQANQQPQAWSAPAEQSLPTPAGGSTQPMSEPPASRQAPAGPAPRA
jgi:hypothetical protein